MVSLIREVRAWVLLNKIHGRTKMNNYIRIYRNRKHSVCSEKGVGGAHQGQVVSTMCIEELRTGFVCDWISS